MALSGSRVNDPRRKTGEYPPARLLLPGGLDASGGGGALFMDTYDRRLDYGNADFDIPQRLTGSFTYNLPVKVNGFLGLYSGLPFSVQSASNTLNTGGTSRASYIFTVHIFEAAAPTTTAHSPEHAQKRTGSPPAYRASGTMPALPIHSVPGTRMSATRSSMGPTTGAGPVL